jgi:hypothetical protein
MVYTEPATDSYKQYPPTIYQTKNSTHHGTHTFQVLAETKHASQPPLLHFPPSRPIHKPITPLVSRTPTTNPLRLPFAPQPQQHHHSSRRKYTCTQNPNHDQITLAILMWALCISRPPGVQRIRRQDTTKITQTANERRGSGNAYLAVARLEDLVGPCHADGDCRTEAEAYHEQAAVAGPRVAGAGEGGYEEAGYLDEDGEAEEEGAVVVEAVGEGGDDEDGDEVHLVCVSFGKL